LVALLHLAATGCRERDGTSAERLPTAAEVESITLPATKERGVEAPIAVPSKFLLASVTTVPPRWLALVELLTWAMAIH